MIFATDIVVVTVKIRHLCSGEHGVTGLVVVDMLVVVLVVWEEGGDDSHGCAGSEHGGGSVVWSVRDDQMHGQVDVCSMVNQTTDMVDMNVCGEDGPLRGGRGRGCGSRGKDCVCGVAGDGCDGVVQGEDEQGCDGGARPHGAHGGGQQDGEQQGAQAGRHDVDMVCNMAVRRKTRGGQLDG